LTLQRKMLRVKLRISAVKLNKYVKICTYAPIRLFIVVLAVAESNY
jgi:hypothetical protein